jgi:hypothetical protein
MTVTLIPIDMNLGNKTVVKLKILMAIKLFVTIIEIFLPLLHYCIPRRGQRYIQEKHPNRLEENQRLRVLLDSGCSSTGN